MPSSPRRRQPVKAFGTVRITSAPPRRRRACRGAAEVTTVALPPSMTASPLGLGLGNFFSTGRRWSFAPRSSRRGVRESRRRDRAITTERICHVVVGPRGHPSGRVSEDEVATSTASAITSARRSGFLLALVLGRAVPKRKGVAPGSIKKDASDRWYFIIDVPVRRGSADRSGGEASRARRRRRGRSSPLTGLLGARSDASRVRRDLLRPDWPSGLAAAARGPCGPQCTGGHDACVI